MKPSAFDLITFAAKRLDAKGFETPRLDAEVLLSYVLHCDRASLYSRSKTPTKKEWGRFEKFIKRRLKKEPVAYLTGVKEFWSIPIKVTPAVLIPRPETEGIIEEALKLFDKNSAISILDLCTGSGCVAAALASEFPRAKITAADISEKALKIARKNLLFAGKRISFVKGDLFSALKQTHAKIPYDLITANPPYLDKTNEDDYEEGIEYEPSSALFAKDSGTNIARKIIKTAPVYLKPGGWLIMEINEKHGQLPVTLAQKTGRYDDVRIIKDLAGLDRIMVARRRYNFI